MKVETKQAECIKHGVFWYTSNERAVCPECKRLKKLKREQKMEKLAEDIVSGKIGLVEALKTDFDK